MRAIVFIAGLLIAFSAFAAPKFIGADEFSKTVVGKQISSTTQKGNPFTATFKRGGTGDFQQKGKKAATFKWTFSGDTVCWDFGDFKECNKVEIISPASAKFYDAKTGKLNNSYVIK